MKKWIVWIVLLISLIGCEHSQAIKIGVVGTMSGPSSDLAVSGRRGIELKVQEINDAGGIFGRPIELIIKDDHNDRIRSAEIVEEFEDEGVQLVIGPFTSGMMVGAYDSLLEKDMLYLAPTVSGDNFNGIDDNFIRFIASTQEQAYALADLSESLDHRRFAIIMDSKNKGFNTALANNFKKEIAGFDGQVLWEEDFQELNEETLKHLMEVVYSHRGQLDAVFIIASARDLSIIKQRMVLRGIYTSVYGPLWSHTSDLLRLGGQAVENDYFVSGIDLSSDNPTYKAFVEAYQAAYGEAPTFPSLYAYETMSALEYGILQAGSEDWEGVKKAIISKDSFEGLQGSYGLDEYGDSTRRYLIDQVINGEFKRFYEK